MATLLSIILNYNSKAETIALVEQLMKLTDTDILIIDNASETDQFDEFKNERVEVLYREENLGYSGGNNVGLRYSVNQGYEFSWILNPDIRILSNTLDILLSEISSFPNLAAVGPRILENENNDLIYSDGGIIDYETWKTTHKNQGCSVDTCASSSLPVSSDFVNGSCILIRNNTLPDIGLFYEKFFMYYEETDWCYRSKLKGYEVATISTASVIHKRSDKKGFFHYFLTRNRSLISKIHANRGQSKIILLDRIFEFKDYLLFRGKRPFLFERLRGAISGYFTSIEDYKDAIKF